jgi:hypothetical protein
VLVHIRLDLGRDPQPGATNASIGVDAFLQVGLKAIKPTPTMATQIDHACHCSTQLLNGQRSLCGPPQLFAKPCYAGRELRRFIKTMPYVNGGAAIGPQKPVQTLLQSSPLALQLDHLHRHGVSGLPPADPQRTPDSMSARMSQSITTTMAPIRKTTTTKVLKKFGKNVHAASLKSMPPWFRSAQVLTDLTPPGTAKRATSLPADLNLFAVSKGH